MIPGNITNSLPGIVTSGQDTCSDLGMQMGCNKVGPLHGTVAITGCIYIHSIGVPIRQGGRACAVVGAVQLATNATFRDTKIA